MNYYDVLGITPSATPDDIKQAYREMVEIHHPDRMQGLRPEVRERAEGQLRLINEAYAVLRNPNDRIRYDAVLAGSTPKKEPAFKPTGNPAVAKSKLKAKLEQIERDIQTATLRLADLKPRAVGQELQERRWERYLFTSVLVGFPFILGSRLLVNYADANRETTSLLIGMGSFMALGYITMLLIMAVSRVGLRTPGYLRLLGTVPLATVVIALVAQIPMREQSFVLMAILWGYITIVWENAGKIVAESRDHVMTAIYATADLEEKLIQWRIERTRLQAELARL